MRQAATQKNPARRTSAESTTKPAPVRGWNALDPITSVESDEAIILDNWFPRRSNLETRKGTQFHFTAFGSDVWTVMPYHGITANKLFAATHSGIWDATVAGVAPGAPDVAMVNGKIQHTNFSTQGANYLVCVNGLDEMQLFNGTVWQAVNAVSAPIAITGIDTFKFVHVNSYKERLFFVLRESMSFAYLPPAAVGGAASIFPLQGIFNKGGYLMAMGTWTVDSGNGADDHAVFLTSEGEIAVYTGTDPGDSNNWSLVGVYALGRPLSRKCMCKLGGDLLLVLRDGIFSVASAMQSSSIDRTPAITNRVANAWQDTAQRMESQFGWMACLFKDGPFLLCNIPNTLATTSVQYVMNTTTKAWTRFTGIGGVDWCVLGDKLYVARGRNVCRAWIGSADYSLPITFRAKTGFANFGYPGKIKHWTTVRPVLEFAEAEGVLIGLDVDFEDVTLSGTVTVDTVPYAIWDLDLWDTGIWGPDVYLSQTWTTVASRPGFYAATKIQHESTENYGKWFVTNYIFETGGLT